MKRLFAAMCVLSASISFAAVHDVETVTTDDDHYDKYASVAFDRAGTMWVAYTSMHDDRDEIILRAKSGGRWSRLTFAAHDAAPPAGETSYYVRVTQADGQQAWSSPIWITH